MFDYSVFIGRFQPFHKGHLSTLEEALKTSKHVIIAVGSCDRPRDVRNPWTFSEREQMIRMSVSSLDFHKITIIPIKDYIYQEDLWVSYVEKQVEKCIVNIEKSKSGSPLNKNFFYLSEKEQEKVIHKSILNKTIKVAIIGFIKDHTSEYINNFPNWIFHKQDGMLMLNATDIRKNFFKDGIVLQDWLNNSVSNYLSEFKVLNKEVYEYLSKEYDFVELHKKSWECVATSKYGGPILNTVDAVVFCLGHVLMVKRRAHPGKGLYALPGGYVLENERIKESVLRELKEETKLKTPYPILMSCISQPVVFDDPKRSVRGRIITHAFQINLPRPSDGRLPKVEGSDDAEKAEWVRLSDLDNMSSEIFEDHYFIVKYFVS